LTPHNRIDCDLFPGVGKNRLDLYSVPNIECGSDIGRHAAFAELAAASVKHRLLAIANEGDAYRDVDLIPRMAAYEGPVNAANDARDVLDCHCSKQNCAHDNVARAKGQ